MQQATNLYEWSPHMRANLGDPQWVLQNCERLQQLFPEDWTDMLKTNPIDVGVGLRLIGVDFRTETELTLAIAYLQSVGIVRLRALVDGRTQVKRGPLIVVMQQPPG